MPNAIVDMTSRWAHRSGVFDLTRPLLMGVLNTTPDSFSDGGLYLDPARAVAHAEEMVAQGAGIVDVGGESTRPGALPVDSEKELARVIPVIREIRARLTVPISVDTRRFEVARAALDAGADIVNDVTALSDTAMAELVAETGAGVVLMHMRGLPTTMQNDPRYGDVVSEVSFELMRSVRLATEAGIALEKIVLDPGIGFGKTFAHNHELIGRLPEIVSLGQPVLLGVSRKAFLGDILGGADEGGRAVATAAACVVGLVNGARIFRVHDVGVVRQALDVAHALAPLG